MSVKNEQAVITQQQQQGQGEDLDMDGLYEAEDKAPEGPTDEPAQQQASDDAAADEAGAGQAKQQASEGQEQQPKGHSFDKGLQQTQQQLSTVAKQVEGLAGVVQKLVERFDQPSGKQPTQQQVAQAQEQADELAEALKDLDEFDAVEVRHVKKLMEKLNRVTGELAELRQARSGNDVETYWRQWEADHASVAGQRQDLIQQAADWVQQKYPTATGDQQAAYLTARFDMLVEQAEAKAAQAATQPPQPPEKPKAPAPTTPKKTPDRPTEGTRITQPGASTEAAGDGEPASFEDAIKGLYAP